METALEMTTRHVAEGVARIARQEELIARIATLDNAAYLEEARNFLVDLLCFQEIALAHMALEEQKALQRSNPIANSI